MVYRVTRRRVWLLAAWLIFFASICDISDIVHLDFLLRKGQGCSLAPFFFTGLTYGAIVTKLTLVNVGMATGITTTDTVSLLEPVVIAAVISPDSTALY